MENIMHQYLVKNMESCLLQALPLPQCSDECDEKTVYLTPSLFSSLAKDINFTMEHDDKEFK